MSHSQSPQTTQFADRPAIRSGRARAIGLVLIGLAVTASVSALALFRETTEQPRAWLPYLASTVLIIAASYVLAASKDPAPKLAPLTRPVIAAGVLILGLAAFMRWYRLDTLPFGTWRDEANISVAAERILDDPTFRPIFVMDNVHPFHLYAMIALSFKLFGASTYALRLVTSVFGVATVVIAFFLGREMYGNRFGLLLAFFFAVARWHVTFSRFGIPGITAPFFEVLTIWLMLRARRTGRLYDFAWAGLALGYGLNFYTAFRLFPLVVLVFMLSLFVSWRRATSRQPEPGAALTASLLALIVAAWLAVAPLVQFALLNPENFWGHSSRISIFTTRDEPNLGKALLSNTVEHLLMFNYEGDHNGRHNLPGEPMLDPVLGVLFVLGLGLAFSRLRRLPNLLFLTLFVVGLSGGILSVDFEAPQSNRAIGAVAAVLYFAALAAETFWRGVENARLATLARRGTATLLALGAGGAIVYFNAQTYFVRQANDFVVWEAYNGIETLTAQQMLAVEPDRTTIYATMFLHNHEVINFLAPETKDSRGILPPNGLPIREPGDKPVAIFVDRADTWVVDEARLYYPNAQYQAYTNPAGAVVLQTLLLSPDDIQQIQGLAARYWPGAEPEGEPALTRVERTLAADWSQAAPLDEPYVAEWSGVLYAPNPGDYELHLQSPKAATLWLDETAVLDGSDDQRLTLSLAQGNHALRVQAAGGAGEMRLAWRGPEVGGGGETGLETIPAWALYLSPPVSSHGLRGAFFKGPDWQPPAAFERIDPYLDMYFHVIPLHRPYSVEWTGQIEAPTAGEYTFSLRIHGQAQLFIDDQLVVENSEQEDNVTGKIDLSAGWHALRLRYLDNQQGSRIHLYWIRPGAELEVVPSNALLPYP